VYVDGLSAEYHHRSGLERGFSDVYSARGLRTVGAGTVMLDNTAKAVLEIATEFDELREMVKRLCPDTNYRNYALTAISDAERRTVKAYYGMSRE
jgi:hypothetical protein